MPTIYPNADLGGRRSGHDRRMYADPNYKGIERRILKDRRKGTGQRKSPRFLVKEGSFAAIDSNYGIIGNIKNISQCGLAFKYIPNEKQLSGHLKMDIFHKSRDFFLKDLTFQAIADFYVDSKSPFNTIMFRQCNGKFDGLTDNQTSQIDYFIRNYTLGQA